MPGTHGDPFLVEHAADVFGAAVGQHEGEDADLFPAVPISRSPGIATSFSVAYWSS